MKITKLVYILMPAAILAAFLLAPRTEILGDTGRIIYFHVPAAMVSVIAFAAAGVWSVMYIIKKGPEMLCRKAAASAGLGLLFSVITLITGSLWAKMAWGSFWNWDPRETSVLVLLLIYIAYFSLNSSLGNSPAKGRIGSVYLILAMAVMPFFVFVIPRIYQSLHPDTIINAEGTFKLDSVMRITLLISSAAFIFLYCHLMSLKNRLLKIEEILDEKEEKGN